MAEIPGCAKDPGSSRHLWFAEVDSQNQWRCEVDRLIDPEMLDFLNAGLIKKIEPQRILGGSNGPQQPIFELHPLRLADLAFENRLLHAHAIIFARSGHPAQAPLARLGHRGDIVCNEHKHGGLLRRQRNVIGEVAPQMPGQDSCLNERHLPQPQSLIQQGVG